MERCRDLTAHPHCLLYLISTLSDTDARIDLDVQREWMDIAHGGAAYLKVESQRPLLQRGSPGLNLDKQIRKCGMSPLRMERKVVRTMLHGIKGLSQSMSSVEAECSMLTSACQAFS